MEYFVFGQYDPTSQEFTDPPYQDSSYVDTESEQDNRKEFSFPLVELRNYLNKVVNIKNISGTNKVVQLRITSTGLIQYSLDGTEWIDTASSGHIIIKPDGNAAPQRTKLKFLNTTVTDDGDTTIIEGVQGPQGERGPQGQQGIQGPQGPQGNTGPQGIQGNTGASGKSMVPKGLFSTLAELQEAHPIGVAGDAYAVGTSTSNVIYCWDTDESEWTNMGTLRGPQGATGNTGPQGPQGPQGVAGAQGPQGQAGADGRDFVVKGLYATYNDLITAHPTGSQGDAYAVGSQSSNVIYLWDIDHMVWQNIGALQGPQGPQGATGPQGPQGEQGPIGATGATGPQGPQGETGQQGPQGVQGEQGIQGPQGVQGPEGPQGPTGPQGQAGQGVASGGTTGQVLKKHSDSNYDTEWGDAGGNWGSISGNIGDQQDLKEALDGKSEVNVGPCIIVKAPSGSSVSVTNGTTTYAITMTSNEYYCYLNRRGSWTVTYDGKTQTINVTENKDYIANFIATIMGVSRDITSSTSVLTRTDASVGKNAVGSVGNTAGYSDFDTMPIFKDIELVTLESDDKMVKIPKFYYKRYREGNIEYEKITDVEVSGFTVHPAFVRGDNVLDYIYVGAYKTSSNNQSKSGRSPQTNQTRATFRNNARAKGNGWSIIDFSSVMAINTLIKIEFANLNIQSVIGEGCSGKSSATATGTCDSVPNHTGRPAGTSNQVDVVWRGIEGWWGNVLEWVDGLNMNNGSYLVCNDISLYADDTATNYEALGFSQPSGSGYISKMGYDATKPFAEMPIEANGGASVSYSDQVYVSSGWRVFGRGGYWGLGSGCGLFAADWSAASSVTSSGVGSRLLKLPL